MIHDDGVLLCIFWKHPTLIPDVPFSTPIEPALCNPPSGSDRTELLAAFQGTEVVTRISLFDILRF